MIITDRDYLEAFGLDKVPEPKEVPLHGWEMDHHGSITLDDEARTYTIGYVLWDDIEDHKMWKVKKGTDGRWTYVILHKDGKPEGKVGYEFEGLIPPALLREWFRDKLKIKDPEPVKE